MYLMPSDIPIKAEKSFLLFCLGFFFLSQMLLVQFICGVLCSCSPLSVLDLLQTVPLPESLERSPSLVPAKLTTTINRSADCRKC
uniref:Uncharacterized protein n=1 Tax=Anguilla anguilla TaxID=7936 RepID=A0A0E9WX53_ANGAN